MPKMTLNQKNLSQVKQHHLKGYFFLKYASINKNSYW